MIKRKVCEAPSLKYFDPKCATESQGKNEPVAYVSCALMPAEQRYSQISQEVVVHSSSVPQEKSLHAYEGCRHESGSIDVLLANNTSKEVHFSTTMTMAEAECSV